MKKIIWFLSFLFTGELLCSQVMWQFNKDTVITWRYEFGDEFNQDQLDTQKWATSLRGSHVIYSNKEQQYYTDKGNNLQVKDGTLRIIAKKETIEARAEDSMEDKDSLFVNNKFFALNKHIFNYTSGKIEAKKLFNKGFFEIRFKAPVDKGMWPAFWLYGGYPDEEIDIFELKGEIHNKIHVETHCPNDCDYVKTWYGKKVSWGGWLPVTGNLAESFNVIAGEWDEKFVKIYLNGRCIAYSPVAFNIEKYLQVNMAVPSNKGPFHPGPAKDFKESAPFEIDYVRVWKKDAGNEKQAVTQNIPVKPEVSVLPSGKARLKHKKRILFGKESFHKNEGPFVTVVPLAEKSYILYILGLEKGQSVKVELKDVSGKTVNTISLSEFQNKLDFSSFAPGTYKLVVSFNGKSTSREIKLN